MLNNLLFKRLTNSCVDYIAHSLVGAEKVIIEFAGTFEGKSVVWHATIVALNTQPSQNLAQYIEVSEAEHDNNTGLSMEIGLFVQRIDEPTITKVIKMIRQYKNLHRGRHEFSGTNK